MYSILQKHTNVYLTKNYLSNIEIFEGQKIESLKGKT